MPDIIDEDKFPKDKAFDKDLPRVPGLGEKTEVPYLMKAPKIKDLTKIYCPPKAFDQYTGRPYGSPKSITEYINNFSNADERKRIQEVGDSISKKYKASLEEVDAAKSRRQYSTYITRDSHILDNTP